LNQKSKSMLDNLQENEISLADILRFLRDAYKTIIIFAMIGIGIAITYLVITPKQFEATTQIAMAQISAFSNSNNNLNPLGVNIEEPALLISRLALPTSFPEQTISACGFDDKPEPGAALAKAIKLGPSKGVANVVELKTFGASPEIAKACANAIFELIKTTQAQILMPYIEEAKLKLADDNERLVKAKDFVAKADRSGSTMGAAYLSTGDEIRFLLDEITSLRNVVAANQNRATHLIAPIYASDAPIGPKKRVALAVGVLGGTFLGLLIALARQQLAKLRATAGAPL
jgi:uncharacterized protein involved in exopolysaccharide biosynthesis